MNGEIIGGELARFAIVGAYSGSVYATGATLAEAERYVINNGFGDRRHLVALSMLAKGEAWKSHEDARGIKITRTA